MQNAAASDTQPATRNPRHPSRFTFHVSLLVEKAPFFVLAAASSAITILAHRGLGMLDAASRLPLGLRLENAVVSYGRYLEKAVWPCRLAVFYPLPAAWPMWEVVTCGLILLAISGLVLGTARTRPWLLVGWFWLLGVLVPSSGLIQAGAQAMADRFMYIPVIGAIVAAIWGIHGLLQWGHPQRVALSVAGSAVMVFCAVLTRQQLGYWKDSETLFRHAVEVTENNYVAHDNLGTVLGQRGQLDEAIRQFREAIRLKPDHANAHCNLGLALEKTGQTDEAIRQFQEAIRLKPDHANAHCNLGIALEKKGQMDEAMREFQEAIHLEPRHADAHNNLGVNLGKRGQLAAAVVQLQEAIRLKPDHADAHNNLGTAFLQQGRTDEAIAQYREAVRLKPDHAEAQSNLARAIGAKNPPAGR
jgi:Flp pilus assembly protein TadD